MVKLFVDGTLKRNACDLEPVYLWDVENGSAPGDEATVGIVCAGDSITGWNNFGPARQWPYPTYPRFLQALCARRRLRVADGGIAGEISQNGVRHVRRYLELFPAARYFIIGFGTNDLGMWSDVEETSRKILGNLDRMIADVADRGIRPILFNVPSINESLFPPNVVRESREAREHHNARLEEYCRQQAVPLVDLFAPLRDEHFGDELHPNRSGAQLIAEEVFKVFCAVLPPDECL